MRKINFNAWKVSFRYSQRHSAYTMLYHGSAEKGCGGQRLGRGCDIWCRKPVKASRCPMKQNEFVRHGGSTSPSKYIYTDRGCYQHINAAYIHELRCCSVGIWSDFKKTPSCLVTRGYPSLVAVIIAIRYRTWTLGPVCSLCEWIFVVAHTQVRHIYMMNALPCENRMVKASIIHERG